MNFFRRASCAQTIMEYVLMVTVITVVVAAMLPRIKRGTQSLIKSAADQIGTQNGSEQDFKDAKSSYLVYSNTRSNARTDLFRRDHAGIIDVAVNDMAETQVNTLTNMGWSKE